MFGMVPFRGGNVARRKDPWDMGSVFESFFKDSLFPTLFSNNGLMKVDIREDDQNYFVEAELPGTDKNEINLEIEDNMLTISVNRNEETSSESKSYIHKERHMTSMTRSFALDNIIPDQAHAKFENGVLTVTLPKKEAGVKKSRRINIE